TSNQTWLTVTTGATGNGILTFNTSSANLTLSQRVATVLVKATGALDKSIIVTQAMGDTTLIAWQFGVPASLGTELTYNATTNYSKLNTSILKRGTGINACSLPRGFSSDTWVTSGTSKLTAESEKEYYEFSIQPKVGYATSLSTLSAILRRSSNGPNKYYWEYSTDGITFNDIIGGSLTSSADEGVVQSQISLLGIPALQNIIATKNITFRIYAWGASTTGGTFAFGRTTTNSTTNSLAIGGSVVCLPFITTSLSTANLGVEANTNTSVNVTSNTTWTATSDQSWLTVSSGNTGNATLTLNATSANLMANPRTAIVTLKATDVIDKTITVTQAGSAPYMTVSTDNISINPSENNTASISIVSNATWMATSLASWLTVDKGTIGDAILIATASDTQESSRQATITISAHGVPDKIVTVTQTWGVNGYKYQMNMTVTAIVTINDNELSTSDLQLSVFIGDECRGLAKLQYVAACNRYMAFIMVAGNKEDMNKIVTFRSLNLTNKIEHTAINGTLGFMPETRTGSPSSPYPIRFYQMVTSADPEKVQNVRVYPNPMKDVLHIDCQPGDIQELQLTDAMGRNLIGYSKINTNTINTSHLAKGVYLLHIKCNGSMTVHQLIKQ
ncbi:MAG: BACON domain-containing carbohydrate-binding protein, partial [Paludibacter sp.]